VSHQLVSDLLASYAVTHWLDFGVAIPFYWSQNGERVPAPGVSQNNNPGPGLGDIALSARAIALRVDEGERGPALGFHGRLSLPTGRQEVWQGSALSGTVGAMFDWVWASGTRLGLNAGYRIGGEAELDNIEQNDTVALGLASAIVLGAQKHWVLVPEVLGDLAVGAGGISDVNSPIELLVGARYLGVDHMLLEFGGGTGLLPGAGSPDWRVFVSIGGRSMKPEEVPYVHPCADNPRRPRRLRGRRRLQRPRQRSRRHPRRRRRVYEQPRGLRWLRG
jgi:hypothetical protein